MAKQRNLRGFTRVDAVVGGVACLVLVLLVPVLLAKPRERSIRAVCAANLAQIGKTMFVYANDNEGALPKAGGPTTTWGPLATWAGRDRQMAFGLAADGSGGKATINSCFYLLVKYYQAPTRLFVCRGDKGTTAFTHSSDPLISPYFELVDAWDFGPRYVSYKSCSFSYHLPYSRHALTTSRDPNLGVAADRNPWFISPAGDWQTNWSLYIPDLPTFGNRLTKPARLGNAFAHNRDGQNVLFLDGRVTFETRAYCGVEQDNIYSTSSLLIGGHPKGVPPTTTAVPLSDRDSFLVHDPDVWGSAGKPSKP